MDKRYEVRTKESPYDSNKLLYNVVDHERSEHSSMVVATCNTYQDAARVAQALELLNIEEAKHEVMGEVQGHGDT